MTPTLDGILASTVTATEGEGAVPEHLDRMLARTDGVYHASQAWLEPLPAAFGYAAIRRGLRESDIRPEWRVFNEVGGRSNVKPKLDEVPAILSQTATFFAVGDADLIRARLAHVGAIGGRRRLGFGKVSAFTVDEADADEARHGLLMDDGNPARALPVSMHSRLAGHAALAYAVARSGVSYGQTLAERAVCAVPATFDLNEPQGEATAAAPADAAALDPFDHIARLGAQVAIPAEELAAYATPYQQARRFLERSWSNTSADKAARPWAEGDLVVLTEGASFACTNYVIGALPARRRTTADGQAATKLALRDLLRAPPTRPAFVFLSERGGMTDGNLILSAGGDRLAICSPTGVASVSVAAMSRLFDLVEGRFREDIYALARVGDAILLGDESLKARRALQSWGPDYADVFEALPPRWSHAWGLFLSLMPWKARLNEAAGATAAVDA